MQPTVTGPLVLGVEGSRNRSLRLSGPFCVSCFWLIAATLTVVCLQSFWMPGCGYNNIYLPDGYTYFNFLQDEFRSPDYFSFIFDATGSPGIYILYYPFFLLSDKLCVLPNLFLQVGSLVLCIKIFRAFGARAVWLACLGLSANPYTLIAITGPNKEIPLTFFVLLFIYGTIWRPSVIIAVLSILLTGLTRAPFGLMLVGCWVIIVGYRLRSRLTLLVLAAPLAAVFFFRSIYESTQVQDRYVAPVPVQGGPIDHFALSSAGLDHPLLGLIMFGFRCVANAFSMVVRFSFWTDYGELALLGTAYWIYGIALGISMLNVLFIVGGFAKASLIRNLGMRGPDSVRGSAMDQPLKCMVATVVFVWLCVSVNLLVQPRYLMPLLPILMGVLGHSLSRTRTPKLLGGLVLAVAVYLTAQIALDIANPPAVMHDDFKPEYLP